MKMPMVPISSPTAAATANPCPSLLFLLTVSPLKTPILATPSSFSFQNPRHSVSHHVSFRPHCSNKVDSTFLPSEDEDINTEDTDNLDVVDIEIEIEKTGKNCRRIRSAIAIQAPLNTVWNLLTDYERLADFIPGLAVCRLLHKTPNYARLFQIGQQNLAFGLKFNAKGIVDCYETPLESLPNFGQKRDIEFNMVEGDFEIFQGKWSLLQQLSSEIADQEMHTTLSYSVDVKPKLWLPVGLVEGRLCKEIKINLACIRQEALKITHNTTSLHTR